MKKGKVRKVKVCFLCEQIIKGVANEHHVTPQSRGGKKGKKVYLHPDCHDSLHAQAYSLLAGSNKEWFIGINVNRERLQYLLKAIIKAEYEGERESFKTMLEIPSNIYTMIKLYKKDKRINNLEKTILRLIVKGLTRN